MKRTPHSSFGKMGTLHKLKNNSCAFWYAPQVFKNHACHHLQNRKRQKLLGHMISLHWMVTHLATCLIDWNQLSCLAMKMTVTRLR